MGILCRSIRLVVLLVLLLTCTWSAAQEIYFPPKVFGEGRFAKRGAEVDSFLLKRLEEPSLFTKAQSTSAEAYRFLWLRTFHSPIAVRLEVQPDGTSLLTTKIADGHAGFPYTVTKLIQNTTRSLSREQTDAFRRKVQSEGFWSATSRDTGGPSATDCDGWTIEGIKNGKYHVAERSVPNRLPQNVRMVRKLGLMLAIELGGMKIPEDER